MKRLRQTTSCPRADSLSIQCYVLNTKRGEVMSRMPMGISSQPAAPYSLNGRIYTGLFRTLIRVSKLRRLTSGQYMTLEHPVKVIQERKNTTDSAPTLRSRRRNVISETLARR